jgi:hypothetical protein
MISTLFILLSLAPPDTCQFAPLGAVSAKEFSPLKVSKNATMVQKEKWSVESSNSVLRPFHEKYHQYFEGDKSDSSIILHKFSMGKINKSLVIDLAGNELRVNSYRDNGALVCRTRDLTKSGFSKTTITALINVKDNVPVPFHWEAETRFFAISIRSKTRNEIYYICVDALPRDHFVKDWELKPSSEWAIVERLIDE